MEPRGVKHAVTVFIVLLIVCIVDHIFGRPSWIWAYMTAIVGICVLLMLIVQRRSH